MGEDYPGYAGDVGGVRNPNAWGSVASSAAMGGLTGALPGLGMGALAAFLPMLFSSMFQRGDPQAQMNERIRQILSPGNINSMAQQNFTNSINSPAFAGAQRSIWGGSNQMANSIGTRMAGSLGGASSRFQQAAVPMARANAGMGMGQLYANTWDNGQSMAMRQAQDQAGLYGKVPNYGNNLLAGGLNSWLPMASRTFNEIYQQNQLKKQGK